MKKILVVIFCTVFAQALWAQQAAADYFAIAQECESCENWAGAVDNYKKAVAADGTYIDAYLNLAAVYERSGMYESARLIYLDALKVDKDNPAAYFGIGKLYFKSKLYTDTIQYMREALFKFYAGRSKQIYDASYYLAYSYYNLRKYDEALPHFKLIVSYFPDDTDIPRKIAELEAR